LKRTLRIAIVFAFTCAALAAFSNFAQAQRIDIAFGVSTAIAPGPSVLAGFDSQGNPIVQQSLTGGAYPGFSGDVLFWHNLGVGAEVSWKASQGSGLYQYYDGVNYRPVFYNFNAVYSPKLASHAYLELVGGIGAISTHFYVCQDCQQFGGSGEVASSSHFDADFGGGIKLYLKHGFFIRPEARVYWINNNTNFVGSHATRVGASIGYTFK